MDNERFLPITFSTSQKNHNLEERGMLLAIDGIDGSGKTTVSRDIKDRLEYLGFKVCVFRSSSDYTDYWKTVMRAKELADAENETIPASIDQTLHTVEFLMYCKHSLPGLLAKNDIVIADRYLLSRLALCRWDTKKSGSVAEKIILSFVNHKEIPLPDVTIFLDIDIKEALFRIKKAQKRPEEKESEKNLIVTKNQYLRLVSKPLFPCNIVRINANNPVPLVTKDIETLIKSTMNKKQPTNY